MTSPRRNVRRVLLLAAAAVVLFGLQSVEVWKFSQRQVGLYFLEVDGGLIVTDLVPALPAAEADLQIGDDLVALEGHNLDSEHDFDAAQASRRRGETLTFTVDREGRRHQTSLVPGGPFPTFGFGIKALVVLCYLLIGPLALFKRPGYLRAELLYLLTVAVAIELSLPGEITANDWYFLAGLLLNGLQMGVELHLASVIPERQRWLDRLQWAVPGFYLLGIGLALGLGIVLTVEILLGPVPWDTIALTSWYATIVQPLWAFSVLFLLGRQALRYPESGGRKQAAIVALGVTPWAALVVLSEIDAFWSLVPAHLEEVIWNLGLLGYPVAVLLILWHEAANQERIVLDLTKRIQREGSVSAISQVVSADLHSAFHPKCTHVFYRRRHSRDLTLGHSTTAGLEEEVIPEDSALLRLVEAAGRAVDYPLEVAGLPPDEAEWLARLDPRLLVPVRGRDVRLLGLLVLGQKKSEEPYTPHDRKLLRALTTQIALVYENARLHDQVDQSHRIQREVLSRLGGEELTLVKECPECGRCFDAAAARCPDDGSELLPSIPVERLVAGRYRLDRRLDRGGMGAIYEAKDRHLDRRVAVKILTGAFVTAEVVRRFALEARLTASLRHPNIVTVHDYGNTNTGAPFLVLELLRGSTLASSIATEGPQDPSRLARWLDQVCRGVGAAHDARVIHRDLKPANIFVTLNREGQEVVKILDFGVAKLRTDALRGGFDLTAPGALVGTSRYMAPEQLTGREADERSDIFSVGVLSLEAVLGQHPFGGETPLEILRRIETNPVRVEGSGTAMITAVLARATSLHPEDRYQSVSALRRDLVPALGEIRSIS